MENIKIYTLSHPITKEIRYVGKTKCSLLKRFNHHINKARRNPTTHRDNWINLLLKNNLLPIIELVDENNIDYEVFWINQFTLWGFNLTNMTSGGEGRPTYKMTEETKLKISFSNKGNKHTEETKQKMSDLKKGIKWGCDLKRKENHRKSLIGKKCSEETKLKIGISNGMKINCYQNEVFFKQYNSQKECAKDLKIPNTKISEVILKKLKRYKNYTFFKI